MRRTVERARLWLRNHSATVAAIGGPFQPNALALMVIRESGAQVDKLTSQGGPKGFWEHGWTLRTVAKLDGSGTAKEQDVDPRHGESSLYGAQADFYDTRTAWLSWLADNGFEVPGPDDDDQWSVLMYAPYSMGWAQCRALLLAGRKIGRITYTDPVDAIRGCLQLDDAHLPDIGPQTDQQIRWRILQLLDMPHDADQVADLVKLATGYVSESVPVRTGAVRPFPRFKGPGGLQSQLRALAKVRNLPD